MNSCFSVSKGAAATRIGDLVVIGNRYTNIGDLETQSELLEPAYPSHGSPHETRIPLLIFNCKEDLPFADEFTTNLDLTRIPFGIGDERRS